MQATAAALLLLVLAVVARGGEAREVDGLSARQLLTDETCKYPTNCHKVKKHECEWLPEGKPECDYKGKTYHVKVKNCFEDKVSYVSIDNGHECTKYHSPKPGHYFATLELKCNQTITIYGYDHELKGDGSKSCNHKPTDKDCKTCKYEATYHCKAKAHPGYKCHKDKPKGDCEEFKYDHECKCRKTFKPNTTVCRKARGECDEEEKCTGHSPYCPHDKVKGKDTHCRDKDEHKPCDVEDTCDGESKKCKDKVADKGTVCRKAKGPCDAEEVCDGKTKKCPEDCCVYTPKKPYCPVKYI